MARPKKKPEPQKLDGLLIFIAVVSVLGAVFLAAYAKMSISDFKERNQVFAEQIKSLDNLLVKRKETIDSLQNNLSSASLDLMKEQEKSLSREEVFSEKEKDYRERIIWLRTEMEKKEDKIQKLESEVEILKTQKPKIQRRPRGNDGVVRPRVYKW